MKVKIDTKEKFHVISVEEPVVSANMTEDLNQMLLPYLETENKNIILKLREVKEVDKRAAERLLNVQQTFYDRGASFVICEMQKPVEEFLEQRELLEVLNIVPTESEAWDIVQMEEIEREFFDETPNP
jgi:anti-anti-sigma regulatory factor